MKREEAKKYDWFRHDREDIEKHIDKIYDDIESRTCENCEYFRNDTCSHGWWGNNNIEEDILNVHSDFGCNKFKRKQ